MEPEVAIPSAAHTHPNATTDNPCRNFAKVGDAVEVPNLIDIQTRSYARFLQKEPDPDHRQRVGLEALLCEVFPIESYDRSMSLRYVNYELGKPRYTPDECRQLGLTYGMPFHIRVRLLRKGHEEIQEDRIYLGTLPQMIGGGEFIINGAERAIVSFCFIHSTGKKSGGHKLAVSFTLSAPAWTHLRSRPESRSRRSPAELSSNAQQMGPKAAGDGDGRVSAIR